MANLDSITQDALHLSQEQRGILATRILESMDEERSHLSREELFRIREAWIEAAEHRLRDIEEGRIQTLPEAEVERRVRAMLG